MGFIANNLPTLDDVSFGTASGAKSYVYRLDGLTKYFQLSEPINIPLNGSIELDLLYDPNTVINNDYILCSETDTSTSSFFTSRETIGVGGSGIISSYTVDGISTSNFPYDNTFHTIKYNFDNINGKLKFLGTRFTIQQLSSGVFKDLIVRDAQGIIINHIPLTNKEQGATQLPTVGNVSATIVNYTESGWEEV